MNYEFTFAGIIQGSAVGSTSFSSCRADPDCPEGQSCISYFSNGSYSQKSCRRLDYSTQRLPVGGNTPGVLDQTNLDELAGLGSGTADLTAFDSCQGFALSASDGPVDWNLDGVATEQHVAEDIDIDWIFFQKLDPNLACSTKDPLIPLRGSDDWAYLLGPAQQIAPAAATPDQEIPRANSSELELDIDTARQLHVLLAVRPAAFVVLSSSKTRTNLIPADSSESVVVALLATDDFDVNEVNLSSLRFHHASPISTTFRDVNADGRPDLVIEFRSSDVHLAKEANRARITGWLKSSQAFVGEHQCPAR